MVYFEYISFFHLLFGLIQTGNFSKIFKGNHIDVFYVDMGPFTKKAFVSLFKMCGVQVRRLDFKMLDIKDEKGELIRLRIPRSDLFAIRKGIMESEACKSLCHDSWRQDRIDEYVDKGLLGGGIQDEGSVSRSLFIIEIVAWHMNSRNCKKSSLVMRNRPWFNVYKDYAIKYKINLFRMKYDFRALLRRSFFYKILIKYPLLYGMLKNIKYGHVGAGESDETNSMPKIYVEGRGDVNFKIMAIIQTFFGSLTQSFPKKIFYINITQNSRGLTLSGMECIPWLRGGCWVVRICVGMRNCS